MKGFSGWSKGRVAIADQPAIPDLLGSNLSRSNPALSAKYI
jgi:hypothetical protein